MDFSRRETLPLGRGVAGGQLTGGLIGVGARRLDTDGPVGGNGDEPMQRIVGTRDDECVETACDAVVGDGNVVELGDRWTLVVGPLAPDEARELAASDAVDYVEPDRPVTAADAALAPPAVQPVATPWGVDRIRAPAAHEAGYRGADARVAVVDSGESPHSDSSPTSVTAPRSSSARESARRSRPTTPATGQPARGSSPRRDEATASSAPRRPRPSTP